MFTKSENLEKVLKNLKKSYISFFLIFFFLFFAKRTETCYSLSFAK